MRFRYSPDRKGERPLAHLEDFTGILQADGYAGFERLYARGDIMEAACWAHVRRKFYDIHDANDSPIAAEALSRIGALYAIEADIRGRPPDEREAHRQARAGPLLDDLHDWLQRHAGARCRRSRNWPWRSATRSRAGLRSPATATTAASRSTTTPPSGPARGGARPQELSLCRLRRRRRACCRVLQPDRHREAQRPGPGSYLRTCSSASPSIRSTASTNCCHGISQARPPRNYAKPRRSPLAPAKARAGEHRRVDRRRRPDQLGALIRSYVRPSPTTTTTAWPCCSGGPEKHCSSCSSASMPPSISRGNRSIHRRNQPPAAQDQAALIPHQDGLARTLTTLPRSDLPEPYSRLFAVVLSATVGLLGLVLAAYLVASHA